jgi:hypothetical protein
MLCGVGGEKVLGAQTVISQVTSAALRDTNGQKIIAAPGGLHAVFVSGSTVKYMTSTDGITWSAPPSRSTVEIGASRPAIAAAGNTIGVAYVKNSYVYYRYKQSNGTWSTPVQFWPSPDVSMVGYGSTMYLTLGGYEVMYFSFPATAPSASTLIFVGGSLICGTTIIYTPAIAVMPMSATNPTARVRIAYFRSFTPDSTCQNLPATFGLELYEKQGTGGFIQLANGIPLTANHYGVSTSLAANTGTGEFYLGASYGGSTSSTFIQYQHAWNNGQWRNAQILPKQALIDIAAASCGKFRIAVSDIISGNGTYGPTWYRSGEWLSVNPNWAEPQPVQVTVLGRDPQAFFWNSHSGPIIREIQAMFEESSGTSYFVKHTLVTRRASALYDCRIKDVREATRDAVAQVHE